MSPFPPTLFAGKRFAVAGLGANGLPAANALRAMGATVEAWDDSEAARAGAAGHTLRDFREGALNFDAMVLSPGIPHILPKPHPIAARAIAAGLPIVSDAELLYLAVRLAGSRARFVGITGTNGKSTTTALLAHVLKQAGRPVAAGGNLGPASLALPLLPDDGIYVLEMSSYMLERLDEIRFDAAAMLNLSADHLDRHGDMAGYAMAKRAIFGRQTGADLAVIGVEDSGSRAMAAWLDGRPAKVVRVAGASASASVDAGADAGAGASASAGASAGAGASVDADADADASAGAGAGAGARAADVRCENGFLRDDIGPILHMANTLALPGAHNAQNAAACFAIASFLGLDRETIAAGIASFPGLPHRQEKIVTVDGVTFINDSKATNADSARRALMCHDKLIWIAGGMGKEGGIVPLAPCFPRIAHAFLIGRDAPIFAETLRAHGVPFDNLATLDAAVPAAFAAAKRTHTPVVLLSPATASWDQFKSFEHRGLRFGELARALVTPALPKGDAE